MSDYEDQGSEEEDFEEEQHYKPSFVVVAIDTHPSMFVKDENGTMPFRNCLKACLAVAESLVFNQNSRSWSQFAIVLAREEADFVDFRSNVIDTVKLLKYKINLSDKQIIDEFQRKDFDLASFFLSCKKMFHDIKSTYYKRTLIYVTNDDDPVQDAPKRFTALNEVKTFCGSQISFQVVPTREDFNYEKFYNELLSLLESQPVEEICVDKEGLVEKLTSVIIKKHYFKVRFYPFKDDITHFLTCIKFDVVNALHLNNIVVTKDGEGIKTVREIGNETYTFKRSAPGCEIIKFNVSEKMTMMKNSLPVGLILLYVSKRITDVGCTISKPFLIQEHHEEKLPYFKKLWQNCVEKNRVLICARKQTNISKLQYAELIPLSVNGFPTFLVKRIPFSDDITYPMKCEFPKQEQDGEKKEAMRKLVDTLTFDFDVKMIPDLSYRKRKAFLKSKLLDEPLEEVDDVSLNVEALDDVLKEVVTSIRSNFILTTQKKRKAAATVSRAKKTK